MLEVFVCSYMNFIWSAIEYEFAKSTSIFVNLQVFFVLVLVLFLFLLQIKYYFTLKIHFCDDGRCVAARIRVWNAILLNTRFVICLILMNRVHESMNILSNVICNYFSL